MFFKPLSVPLFSVLALGLVVLSSCETPGAIESLTVPMGATVPSATGRADAVVLPFDTSEAWLVENVFPKTFHITSLNSSELNLVDSLMEAFVTGYNLTEAPKKQEAYEKGHPKDTLKPADFSFDMKAYKKQYIAAINAKGEKEVWVNCFCKSIEKRIEFTDWRVLPVRASGGGTCFFNVKLNLSKKTYSDLHINDSGS